MAALADLAADARAAGEDAETIARRLAAARNALKLKHRALGSSEARERAEQRSRSKHGDMDGPSIARLRAQGRSWDEIIAAACRPGRV